MIKSLGHWSTAKREGGGGAQKVLPCLEGGRKKFRTCDFRKCAPGVCTFFCFF